MSAFPPESLSNAPPPPKPQPGSGSGSVLIIVFVVLGILALFGVLCIGGMAAALLPAISAAQDAAAEAQHKNHLRQLGIVCYVYADQDPRTAFPSSWADVESTSQLDQEELSALRRRSIVLVPELTMRAIEVSRIPSSQIVLAYPDDPALAPTEQVSVLMADGSVQDIPAKAIQDKIEAFQSDQQQLIEQRPMFE